MLVQINQKGQLTVPRALRQRLGLRPGDVLELEARGEVLVLRPCAAGRPVERNLSATVLSPLEGVASLGGNAHEDVEALYDEL